MALHYHKPFEVVVRDAIGDCLAVRWSESYFAAKALAEVYLEQEPNAESAVLNYHDGQGWIRDVVTWSHA